MRKANPTSGRKTAKAKNRAALSAQQTIPYVAMHPDGVCKMCIRDSLRGALNGRTSGQSVPRPGKEETILSKDVILTPEQITAEERRWLFDAPIAELAEVKGVTVDEAVKLRTDAILQEAAVPIEVTVRPIEPQGKLIGFASVNSVSYTHLDVYKRQAQRLGITATTLEGILTVKGQGKR